MLQFVIVSQFAYCLLRLLKASEHFDITYKTWGVASRSCGQLVYYYIEVRGDYNIDIYLQVITQQSNYIDEKLLLLF